MRTKFSGILTLLLAFAVQLSFAQQKTISGTVSDDTGMPLPGVNIVVKGTTAGTQSDFDGNYSINTSVGQTLEFSYVGFETVERPVTASTTSINLQMVAGAALEEVVVTAYGRKRTRNELTGSVVTVGTEDIQKVPFVSVEQSLQGRVAGLTVNTTSGVPGASQQVRIRGIQSVNASNEPLYVIDGVPVIQGNVSGSTSVTSMNVFAMIGSDNIESITVLKDAVSTAPYGASGSNGVIMITTKTGKVGKTRFSLAASTGVINNAREGLLAMDGFQKWEMVQSGLWNTLGDNNYGGTGVITSNTESAIYDHIMNTGLANQPHYRALAQWTNDGRPNYDWTREVTNRDALMQNVDFSVTQGDEKSNLYAAIGYNYTEATVIGSDFERINGAFKYATQLNDKFKLTFSANISNAKQNAALENAAYFSNPNLSKYFLSPWVNPYHNGKPNIDPDLYVAFTGMHNTLFTAVENIRLNDVTKALQSTAIEYRINDKLTFNTIFNVDYTLNYYKDYWSPLHGDGLASGGVIQEQSTRYFNYTSQNQLDYRFTLGEKHNFFVTALSEFTRFKTFNLYGAGTNLANDFMTNISAATDGFDAHSSFSDRTSLRYVGLLSYNFDQKYVLEGSVSYQGDSRFIKDQRFDWFYSAGLGWNVHRESFMSDISFINELRLKAGYGITGNAGINRNTYQALASVGDYNAQAAMLITGFGSMVAWETGIKRDLGLEFTLWDRRIKGNFGYYSNETQDLLMLAPLGMSAQFVGGSAMQNLGDMTNKGFEAELSVDVISTGDFNWNINGNFSTVDNLVTRMPEDANIVTATRVVQTGYKVWEWYLPEWAGVNPQTGAPQWYTNTPILDPITGDPTGELDRTITEDIAEAEQIYTGHNALPSYSGGISTRFDYKGFFLEGTLYFAGGHKVYEDWAGYTHTADMGRLLPYNASTEVYNGTWRQPGDVATHPRMGSGLMGTTASTRFLYDGDYIRLRDIGFGYTFKPEFVQQMGLDGMSIAVRGTNLFTWTKDSRLKWDPEINADGFTNLTTPPVKSVVFQLNVNF